ncbi:MAG: hypothetical protein PPP58_01345 [Natronomonas sp.]
MIERIAVWTVGITATAVFVLGSFVSTPPARLLVAALGVVVVAPLAFVAVGWLLGR